MKRRDFIVGGVGLLVANRVSAGTPCPPSLNSASSGAVCPIPSGTALASVANQISVNGWADFPAGQQSYQDSEALAWQTDFYHDAVNGRIHLLGKPAHNNTGWTHQYFEVASNSWVRVTSGISGFNSAGHIYGDTAFDEATGDLYQNTAVNSLRRAYHFRHASQSWDRRAPVNVPIYSGSLNATWNGMAWHPNLYGSNDGGLVFGQPRALFFWRKSNDSMDSSFFSTNLYGKRESAAIYWPKKNAVIIGGGIPGSSAARLAMVTPNTGGTPIVTTLSAPPVRTAGQSSTNSGFGSIHVHPGNPDKLLIVESVGQRAWTSTNGSTWTQINSHPFNFTPRVVCSLRANLGCLWAVGRSGSTSHSRFWKPAA